MPIVDMTDTEADWFDYVEVMPPACDLEPTEYDDGNGAVISTGLAGTIRNAARAGRAERVRVERSLDPADHYCPWLVMSGGRILLKFYTWREAYAAARVWAEA